ncbi:MAG: hypothetical protein LLG44_13660 [Chloroflexi bacterium]|nr:hypothetical protein [Chloroflexota bacterium]
MLNSDAPLAMENLYKKSIAVTVADPPVRSGYASQALEFKALNEAALPEDADARAGFLADLSAFLRTGEPGRFCVAEENLREHYLVDIGGRHRLSRKIYATHPLMPGMLLVVGGVGIVMADEANYRLTIQTPMQDATLHGFLADLPKTSMSAAYPTPQKTIESNPNVDPLGGYSIGVAERKFHNSEMIHAGKKGIYPDKFPVVTNIAWGIIGKELAFYVYAVPANAIPVCNLLHANNREEITAALAPYIHAGQMLMRALRHLHEAGYVHNQPHQGNVYYYQDYKGEDLIVIADLDTLQSIKDFSSKVPDGQYLSPMAFATLVNVQVAATHIAHIAWIDFVQSKIKELKLDSFPGIDRIYALIITDLLAGYINIPDGARRNEVYNSIRAYFNQLDRQLASGRDGTSGIIRLLDADLYEKDVFGFIFTYLLMNEDYCQRFGARRLTDGITPSQLDQAAKDTLAQMKARTNKQALAGAMNQAMSQIIETRSNQAMQEFYRGLSRRTRNPGKPDKNK